MRCTVRREGDKMQDTDRLIRELRAELAVLRGEVLTPQVGCVIHNMPLDGTTIQVEFEIVGGMDGDGWNEPRTHDSYVPIGAFVNGCWIDASLFGDVVRDKWADRASELEMAA